VGGGERGDGCAASPQAGECGGVAGARCGAASAPAARRLALPCCAASLARGRLRSTSVCCAGLLGGSGHGQAQARRGAVASPEQGGRPDWACVSAPARCGAGRSSGATSLRRRAPKQHRRRRGRALWRSTRQRRRLGQALHGARRSSMPQLARQALAGRRLGAAGEVLPHYDACASSQIGRAGREPLHRQRRVRSPRRKSRCSNRSEAACQASASCQRRRGRFILHPWSGGLSERRARVLLLPARHGPARCAGWDADRRSQSGQHPLPFRSRLFPPFAPLTAALLPPPIHSRVVVAGAMWPARAAARHASERGHLTHARAPRAHRRHASPAPANSPASPRHCSAAC
jgi:hypothetical protein